MLMDHFSAFAQRHIPGIEGRIEAFFERCIHNSVSAVQKNTYEAYSRFTLRPGKRIRPLVMLISCVSFDHAVDDTALQLAALIEIMHATLLVHDDIIDCADMRRGAPSLHRIFDNERPGPGNAAGEYLALIAADLVVFECIEEALRSELPRSLLCEFAACYRQTNLGQLLDIAHEGAFFGDENVPAMVMKYKTASYTVVYPFLMGCSLAGKLDAQLYSLIAKAMYPLGENFQLRDDYLGVFSSQQITGKSANDLVFSKYTALIHNAWLMSDEKRLFQELFLSKNKSSSDIQQLMQMIMSSGALDRLRDRMKENLNCFRNALVALPLKAENIDLLCSLGDTVSTLSRENILP